MTNFQKKVLATAYYHPGLTSSKFVPLVVYGYVRPLDWEYRTNEGAQLIEEVMSRKSSYFNAR